MSYMKMLEEIIANKVHYNEGSKENEHSFLQLRDEVNECKLVSAHGQLEVDQLSAIARDCVNEWQDMIEEEGYRDCINHAEAELEL